MFRCEKCNKNSDSNQPLNKIILDKRPKTYTNEIKNYRNQIDTKQTNGWEIIKEIKVCAQCYQDITGQEVIVVKKQLPVIQKPIENKFKNHRQEYKNNRNNNKNRPFVEKLNTLKH